MKQDIFEVEEILIEDGSAIASGSEDPTLFTTEYPIGSIYLRTNGETWKKTGSQLNEWELFGSGGNSSANLDGGSAFTIFESAQIVDGGGANG